MKKVSVFIGNLFFVAAILTSCSTEEINESETLISETENLIYSEEDSSVTDKISSTQWNVQAPNETSGAFKTDISNYYDYSSSKLTMSIEYDDDDIKGGTNGNPRTELRGLKEFKPKDSKKHQMAVTIKIKKLKLTSERRLIIGQLFSHSDGDDFGSLYIKSDGDLVAEFAGTGKKTVKSNVKEGSKFSFKIYTQNGTSKIKVGEKTHTSTKSAGDTCYFKTGAYLISRESGDEAEVEITKLSQS